MHTARRRIHELLPAAALLVLAAVLVPAVVRAAEPVDVAAAGADELFELKIRPVLAGTCFKCHGGDKVSQGLRVDSREALLSGGDSGPAIIPGDGAASLLVKAIQRDEAVSAMPPDGALPAEVVADFRAWIAAGAKWPAATADDVKADAFSAARHWAFGPVRVSDPPADPSDWAQGPIDQFIAARHRATGVYPQPPADRRTLVRRAFFDVIGLPPSPDEMEACLADSSPDWFARLVERLLASPAYGERWGRHWLDVAHYADTAGDNADYPIPEVRLYRDYVIDAFNDDLPFNEFVREQLAGDILARDSLTSGQSRERYAWRIAATGFLALSRRYATAPFELWHLTLEDTLDTVGSAFLGLTLRCARCHDHKYDPTTTADYYALYGIFASTQFPFAGSEEFASKQFPRSGFVSLLPPDVAAPLMARHAEQLAALKTKTADFEKHDPLLEHARQLEAQLEFQRQQAEAARASTGEAGGFGKLSEQTEELLKSVRKQHEKQLATLQRDVRALQMCGLPPDVPCAYAVQEGTPADVPIQRKGDPGQPGEVVPRGVPRFLDGGVPIAIPAGASGRLQLADWLVRPDNPLVPRVIVNRVWQHHFGRGLIATPSNFGLRGAAPTHPELLDWLTARFVADGWSLKSLHRLILSSQTYQMASGYDAECAARDAENAAYWRFERRRLDAEALRDAWLATSGRLDRQRPGVHPFPPIRDWGWSQHSPFKAVYESNHRTVYLMTQRLQRHPYLALFDGPDTNHTTDVRTSSTVPLQALFALNNPWLAEQAAAFAERVMAAGSDAPSRVRWAYELAYGREPADVEVAEAQVFLERYSAEIVKTAGDTAVREREPWQSLARLLLTSNEFVYVD
ncbi:MAG: PSD1 and planctomycete cytochrome C domain-containing protein [Pirellulales bacterium]|nr:PSD1 and planctomycete cytochrome C domain-containing protein [Pirellulales bacterium]